MVLSIVIGIIVVGSLIRIYYHQVQEKEDERIGQIQYYANIAEFLSLGSYYYSVNDPIEVRFYPTLSTETYLERWKVIAGLLPHIEYPESLIKENEWEEAVRILVENVESYSTYYYSKEANEREVMIRPQEVMAFVGYNSRSDNLTEMLEEANFED